MKYRQNVFRTQTGGTHTHSDLGNNLVKFDTLKRDDEAVKQEIGVLHAGVVEAHKHAKKIQQN